MARKQPRAIDQKEVRAAVEIQQPLQTAQADKSFGKTVLGKVGRVPEESGLRERDAKFMQAGKELLENIRSVQIVDEDSFQKLATLGRIGKKIAEAIEEQYAPHIKAADQAHKNLLKWKRDVMKNFADAEAESKELLLIAHDIFPDLEAAGIVFSKGWRFDVTDEKEVPREYLTPDLKKIKGMVDVLGDEFKIAGIQVTRETRVSFRGE